MTSLVSWIWNSVTSVPFDLFANCEIPSTQASHILAKASAPYIFSMGSLILGLQLATSRTAFHVNRSPRWHIMLCGTSQKNTEHHLIMITVIEPKVLFRDKGIGPPHNHLHDQVGIHGCGNQSGDSSITPPQQRELLKPQSLPEKNRKRNSEVSRKIRCK